MNRIANPMLVLLCVLLMGCQSLYTGTVTLTKVVDSASKEYARLYNLGLVPPDVHVKAGAAHANYQRAAGAAEAALIAAKAGKTADVKGTLEAAKLAAAGFIDVLVPLLTREKTATLRADLAKASTI
jgi:hypothetical protein